MRQASQERFNEKCQMIELKVADDSEASFCNIKNSIDDQTA